MPKPAVLQLKKRVPHRILRGHPWVYASEVERLEGEAEDGALVHCLSPRGEFLGSGLYNSQSQIVFRRLTREKVDVTRVEASLLRPALKRALHLREQINQERGTVPEAQRLVWSESDFLPGLIVDRYGDILVLQTLTLGLAQAEEEIVQILDELLRPAAILARNDAPVRKLEGLPQEVKTWRGEVPEALAVELVGLKWEIDLHGGHKTGLYLDQLDNYRAVANYVRTRGSRSVLDVFCNQGGFALAAAKAGAEEVEAIDQSADAIKRAEANATRNRLKLNLTVDNAFDYLRRLEEAGRRYDLVVLDPPSFTRSKAAVASALRGYKELHLRAVRLLEPGGILATFCCSHHIGALEWRGLCGNVAADTGVSLRILQSLGQPPDHPTLVEVPETEYLRGYVLEKC